MKIKCYSVRLASLIQISDKACKVIAFDGSEAIIPISHIFGQDYEVCKSEAYWISAWILEKKSLQYSHKKEAWFDSDTGKMLPTYIIEEYKPDKIKPLASNEIARLKSDRC